MSRNWNYSRDADGIGWLRLDQNESSANLLSRDVLRELDEQLTNIERQALNGLVIHSGKANGFIAGADVTEFSGISEAEQARKYIQQVHHTLNRLEALPCPTLALIHGFCVGGGLELALACDHRIGSTDPATRLGFPEVRLGIFPGFGGTLRSTQKLGPLTALPLMLSGKTLDAKRAARQGLLDAAVPQRQLEAAARNWLQRHARTRCPAWWQRMFNISPLRALLGWQLRQATAKRVSQQHYPAPFALIRHWQDHGGRPEAMLASEAETVAQLLTGDTAQNLVRVFQLRERLKALGRDVADVPRRVHVVGAGVMGGDIAAWCALQGLDVSLQDLHKEQLAAAMQRSARMFDHRLRDPRRQRAAWDRLIPDPRGDGLARADVVIEAIVEDSGAKQALLREVDNQLPAHALLATNTSSIPLEILSQGLERPERLVGLHFFNPVARMQLVEVVRSETISPDNFARAAAFVRRIDRLPLPVRSNPGFLVNRILMPYLLEAMDLYAEGIPAPAIDRAAVEFGMPMGPIELADGVGLDICLAVAEKLSDTLTAPEAVPRKLRDFVQAGRLGRKIGQGFYRYHRGKIIKGKLPLRFHPPDDLAERLVFRLLNEAVACLREGVVEDADLIDAGMIFGTGFAPFRGGPMQYIKQGGMGQMRTRLEDLKRRHGPHFNPDTGWNQLQRV